MSTYFARLSPTQTFAGVPISPDGIATPELLQPCSAVLPLLKTLDKPNLEEDEERGSYGGTPYDLFLRHIRTNVKRLQEDVAKEPEKRRTVEVMLKNERAEGKEWIAHTLLWMVHELEFIHAGLQRSLDNPDEELSASVQHAYDDTLGEHHSLVLRASLPRGLKYCASREGLFESLVSGRTRRWWSRRWGSG